VNLGVGPNPNLYIVYVQARDVTSTFWDSATSQYITQTKAGLYYCGLAREWLGTCKDARLVCSIPGPMFYL
jgi:hypothetical protein